MEIKQNERLSRQDFDKLTREIRAIVGNRLKDHKDGDSQEDLSEELNSESFKVNSERMDLLRTSELD